MTLRRWVLPTSGRHTDGHGVGPEERGVPVGRGSMVLRGEVRRVWTKVETSSWEPSDVEGESPTSVFG